MHMALDLIAPAKESQQTAAEWFGYSVPHLV